VPAFDTHRVDGPGRFFASHPAAYRLSLAGSGGASAYALMRVGSPRGVGRLPWVALAVLEAAIAVGIMRAKKSAVTAEL
jgi:hypothetical protein